MRKEKRLKRITAVFWAGLLLIATVFSAASGQETQSSVTGEISAETEKHGEISTECDRETENCEEIIPDGGGSDVTDWITETETERSTEPETSTETERSSESGISTEPETSSESETSTESEISSETEPETSTGTEINTGTERETETELKIETETEPDTESEADKEGAHRVEIVEGEEFHITLNHDDGKYDAGEVVEFTADVPGPAAVTTAMAEANRKNRTADFLYSEVTYQPENNTFCFEMPEDDVYLGVAADQAEAGIVASSGANPWDEATDIEADTYYYYSDGSLHPFSSVMGEGGNDSYKYVRYRAYGKNYTVSAYCMQHSMQSPPSGTTYKSMVELNEGGDDKYLRKALFYGYGGPGWGHTFCGYNLKQMMEEAGCTSEMRAMQHYLVDYLYDGESGFGGALSAQAKSMLKQIRSALAKMPDPAAMELLPGLSAKASGRETESFTWKADKAFTITIHLEDGVSLVNETTGETASGNVTVKGGEKFHLMAVTDLTGNLNGTYRITSNYPLNFHAMLLKLQKSQDIGFGYYTDFSNIELQVEWPEQKGNLTIYKEGEVLTGASVMEQGVAFLYENRRQSGAVYNVYAGENISNVAGEVIYEKDALVREGLVTGEDGSAHLTDLYPGIYRVTETKAPEKLVCSGESKTVEVGYGGQAPETELGTVTFYNERQKAAVCAVKQDEISGAPLAGGIYGLYAASEIRDAFGNRIVEKDTLIEKAVTGPDGKAVYEADLPSGCEYYIREIQAPELYVRNSGDVYAFEFSYTDDRQECMEFAHVFENAQVRAAVRLLKRDAETGEISQGEAVLEGAVYGLYAREDIRHPDGRSGTLYQAGDLVEMMRTDQTGEAELQNLYLGKYYIKEITAPEGYVLDEREYEVDCSYEGDLVKTVERTAEVLEQVAKQPFQVIKAANNGKTDAELLEGAGFRAYLKEDIPVKADGSYDFSAAEPVVLTADGRTELFTDKNGYACSVAIPYGTYLVRETTTPHNYAPVKDFTVVIREHHPDEPQIWRILLDDEFEAKLKITKKDDETKRAIWKAGAEFRIYDLDRKKYVEQATTYPEHAVHRSYFTDDSGSLVLPEALKIGHYRIEEVTAPEGYLLNENFTEIQVDSNTAYRMDPVDGEAMIEVEYEDHPVKGRLSIYKKGEMLAAYDGNFLYEEKYLKGAEFEVYAAEDIYAADFQKGTDGVPHLLYARNMLVTTAVTDENGYTEISDLPLGRYRIEEKRAPEGFVLQKEPTEVTLAYADQDTPVVEETVIIGNDRQRVALTIEKRDAESEIRPAGAVFGIYAGEDIKAGGEILVKADTLLQEVPSDEHGVALCTLDLPLGRYYVKEKQAPPGYICSEEVFDFDASYQGQEIEKVTLEAVIENVPVKGRVILHKTDQDTGTSLKDVEFELRDGEGNVLETLKTDADGYARSCFYEVVSYKNGKYDGAKSYYLEETKAAKGYEPEQTKHEILFDWEAVADPVIEVRLEVTNKKEKEKIPVKPKPDKSAEEPLKPELTKTEAPKTGDTTNIWIPVLSMAAALGGIRIVWLRRKAGKRSR